MPTLDRSRGFIVELECQVQSEIHSSTNRSGTSLIVLCSDYMGIELAFWENEIWAQGDQPLFVHAEGKTFDTRSARVRYVVSIKDNQYELFANGSRLLVGPLRNYAAAGQPYTIPNFLFLGDDTGSAGAIMDWSFLSVELTPTVSGAGATGTTLLPTGFQAQLKGRAGYSYQVEASTDLRDWIFLTNILSSNDLVTFHDAAATNHFQKFYRVAEKILELPGTTGSVN
jgi:hypothetical protein